MTASGSGFDDFQIPLIRPVPFFGVARLEAFDGEAVADDGSGVGEGVDRADGHGLDADVSGRCRLNGAGDDGAGAGVGGHLVEKLVLGAAADDVDGLDFLSGDVF